MRMTVSLAAFFSRTYARARITLLTRVLRSPPPRALQADQLACGASRQAVDVGNLARLDDGNPSSGEATLNRFSVAITLRVNDFHFSSLRR